MHRICFQKLTRFAAEDALAKLWCRLEEHGLQTPGLHVEFEPEDSVCITLLFADRMHATLALRGIERHVNRQDIRQSAQNNVVVLAAAGSKPTRRRR